MHRAVESATVKLADGSEMFGEALERQLQRMIAYRKLLQVVTRRGNPPEIVTALLQMDARDKTFFEQREKLDVLAARMTTPVRNVEVTRDDEHNAFSLTSRTGRTATRATSCSASSSSRPASTARWRRPTARSRRSSSRSSCARSAPQAEPEAEAVADEDG